MPSSAEKRRPYRDLDELHPVPDSVTTPVGKGSRDGGRRHRDADGTAGGYADVRPPLAHVTLPPSPPRGGKTNSSPRRSRGHRNRMSRSIYAKVDTARMVRNTSKFDLGAMQLSGMTHSASTLNFLQNALDDEVSETFLNRVPSWNNIHGHINDANPAASPGGSHSYSAASSPNRSVSDSMSSQDTTGSFSLDKRARADSDGSSLSAVMEQVLDEGTSMEGTLSLARERNGDGAVGGGGKGVVVVGGGGSRAIPSAASAAAGLSSSSDADSERLPGSKTRGTDPSSPPPRMRRGNSAPPSAYSSPTRAAGGIETRTFGSPTLGMNNGSPSSDSLRGARRPLRLGAIFKPLRNGVDVIVDDSFWRCFEDRESVPWNWNFYLFPIWMVGTLLRFLILFPIRLVLLIIGFMLCTLGFLVVQLWYAIGCSCRSCGHANKLSAESACVRIFASSFVVSWSGVVRYHGIRPSDTMQKRVFVANHSSMIDVAIVLQRDNYSLVGQQHKGWIAFIQNTILASLHCVWFQRGEARDRNAVFRKLQKHARNEQGNLPPLLVFPEGTCVNTDHIIQFKKGVFTLDQDIAICPIALKYNPLLVDAYWNSRRYSFLRHLFHLMTAWALVCDVYYLEPQYRGDDETPVEFAKRVQDMIARQANLISRDWDGYMKYWQPSARFKRAQQLAFARDILPDLVPQMTPKAGPVAAAGVAQASRMRRRR